MITKRLTHTIPILAILGLLLLAGCNLSRPSNNMEDDGLRQTEVALGIQQTGIALTAESGPQETIAAQQATIEAVSAAQTAAAAGGAIGAGLPATQTAMAVQQAATSAQMTSAPGAAGTPTMDMAATQIAIAVQQTSIAAGGAGGAGGGTPTTMALPAFPSETPTTLAGPGFSNFTDNFIDPNSGWPVQTSGANQWYYANNHFYIHVGTIETAVVVTPGYLLADGMVMAEGTVIQEQPKSYFGVVCRFQDINNYYFFEVGTDGFYQIGKKLNGVWSLIGMGAPKPSSTIIMQVAPGAYLQVAGHFRGNQLSLYVNDNLIETVYDNTFASGQIGLSATTSTGFAPFTVAFDRIFAEE